ncbi:unnamed protein product, partial [Mycena citricolor]
RPIQLFALIRALLASPSLPNLVRRMEITCGISQSQALRQTERRLLDLCTRPNYLALELGKLPPYEPPRFRSHRQASISDPQVETAFE